MASDGGGKRTNVKIRISKITVNSCDGSGKIFLNNPTYRIDKKGRLFIIGRNGEIEAVYNDWLSFYQG